MSKANWTKHVKSTGAYGKTHGDTKKEYQDIEGLKSNFQRVPYIQYIEVFHDGKLVYGYQFYYHGGYQSNKRHYGAHAHAGVRCDRVSLEPDEYLTGAGGRFGDLCDQLWFKTSHGRDLVFGGSGGSSKTFDTGAAQKPLILALGAGMGGHVHHIKCFFLDLAKVKPAEAGMAP